MAYKLRDRIWKIPAGETSPLSSAAKFTFLAVATFCNRKTREAWPSVQTLQEMTGLGRRSVQRALRALEGKGLLIAADRSKGRVATVYRFGDDAIDALGNRATVTRLEEPNRAKSTPQPRHTDAQPRHSDALTLKEPEKEPFAGTRTRDGARAPARKPGSRPSTGPGPKQMEMLMPIIGSARPEASPEERLAAARDALEVMADDDPMRKAQGAIVKRIEREIAASGPKAERCA